MGPVARMGQSAGHVSQVNSNSVTARFCTRDDIVTRTKDKSALAYVTLEASTSIFFIVKFLNLLVHAADNSLF